MPTSRSEVLENRRVAPLLVSFSVPAIIGMVVHGLYNIVDRIFIGQSVGSLGISAVTVTFPLMLVLMAFGMLIGLGATALVSIRLGQRQKEEAELVLGNAIVLLVLINTTLMVLGLVFLGPMLELVGASKAILPLAKDYAHIILLGAVFQGLGFGLNNVIRGEGNPRVAMVTMLIGAMMNIVLDALFIFGFGMGVRGAALATVLSQMTTMIWVLSYFVGSRALLRVGWSHLRPRFSMWWSICAIGSAPFAMQLAASVIVSVFNRQLGTYGGNMAVSVFGIVHSMAMMIMMPVFGISQGAQPIIGFNYGAEKFNRVKKTLLLAIVGASIITLLGYWVAMVYPDELVRLFDEKNERLVALGSHAIGICFMMLPLIGFQIVGSNYFQAVGKPRHAMFLSLSRQVILLLPGLLLLPRWYGLDGVWFALPFSDLGSSLLTALWLMLEIRRLGIQHQASCKEDGSLEG